MKLLLDTHLLLWGMTGDERLTAAAERIIRSPENKSFVSVASLWEIAIEVRIGKLAAPDDLPELIAGDPDFELLQIKPDHVWRVRSLPLHHADPFDRLLVAQAVAEGATLVTHDRRIAQYDASVILV